MSCLLVSDEEKCIIDTVLIIVSLSKTKEQKLSKNMRVRIWVYSRWILRMSCTDKTNTDKSQFSGKYSENEVKKVNSIDYAMQS